MPCPSLAVLYVLFPFLCSNFQNDQIIFFLDRNRSFDYFEIKSGPNRPSLHNMYSYFRIKKSIRLFSNTQFLIISFPSNNPLWFDLPDPILVRFCRICVLLIKVFDLSVQAPLAGFNLWKQLRSIWTFFSRIFGISHTPTHHSMHHTYDQTLVL